MRSSNTLWVQDAADMPYPIPGGLALMAWTTKRSVLRLHCRVPCGVCAAVAPGLAATALQTVFVEQALKRTTFLSGLLSRLRNIPRVQG